MVVSTVFRSTLIISSKFIIILIFEIPLPKILYYDERMGPVPGKPGGVTPLLLIFAHEI